MGRKARYTKDNFIRAALEIISEKGPGGLTMQAVAEKSGAPIGSVYHRFKSREILLAELWVYLIESFQSGFISLLQSGDGEKAALYTLDWVRKHPNRSRVFLLYRREQLIKGTWPEDIKEKVEKLAAEVDECLADFTRRRLGTVNKQNTARVIFCLVQVPVGTAKDALESGKTIPAIYDQLVLETYNSVLQPHFIDCVEHPTMDKT